MNARGLAANSTFAFAGDLASKIGLLVVMVVAARSLATQELALLGTALAAAGIVGVCLDAGAGLAITRDGARDEAARRELLAALLVARMPAAALVVVAGAALGLAMGRPAAWTAAALLAVLGALAVSLVAYFRAGRDMRPEALQKAVFAALALGLTAGGVAMSRTADAVLVALACATAISLGSLAAVGRSGELVARRVSRSAAVRAALPLGVMAIATVVYYRSGTVALALLSTPEETAAFTVASAVGFGLLMLPNAITTGLLPHLSAGDTGSTASTRRAIGWSLALSAPVAAAVALGGYVLLGPVFGPAYADAALPLAILCASVVVIAVSGVLGTALLAAGHVRLVVLQVVCSLVVNLTALLALSAPFGAAGAAAATLLCELVAVAMLSVASVRHLPEVRLVAGPAAHTT